VSQNGNAYRKAGVDIDAGNRAVDLMKEAVRSTYTPQVLSNVGSFGGLFDASELAHMNSPVLVASTDGVGTKTRVAARLDRWDTIGQDLVNHCINDILVQGATPLFFMDYVATSQVKPEQLAAIVRGIAAACKAAGCALLGGETAEMPGVYTPGEVDVAGTIIGVVERGNLITGERIQPGNTILALPSSGLHTNGYSLARAALDGLDWSTGRDDLSGASIGTMLLEIHRSYLNSIHTLQREGIDIRGMAHITGGGVIENLPRILPSGTGAHIWRSMPEPPIFALIQQEGHVSTEEMFRVFNMGMGMLVVIDSAQTEQALRLLGDNSAQPVGSINDTGDVEIDMNSA
jgi:phosphoribosylformylglycinamidine cyclo-ligase